MTAASHADVSSLRNEIAKCRDQADGKPFGVNVSMLPTAGPSERLDEVLD